METNRKSMKLQYLEKAGLYDLTDEQIVKFSEDNGYPEEEVRQLLPNPQTGLPMILGLRPNLSKRNQFEKMLERELSLEELNEEPTREAKSLAVLEVFMSLKDEIRSMA